MEVPNLVLMLRVRRRTLYTYQRMRNSVVRREEVGTLGV